MKTPRKLARTVREEKVLKKVLSEFWHFAAYGTDPHLLFMYQIEPSSDVFRDEITTVHDQKKEGLKPSSVKSSNITQT